MYKSILILSPNLVYVGQRKNDYFLNKRTCQDLIQKEQNYMIIFTTFRHGSIILFSSIIFHRELIKIAHNDRG